MWSRPFISFFFQAPEYAGGGMYLIAYGMLFIAVGAFLFFEGKEGQNYKDRKDKYRGVSPIVCTYCSHQNSPHLVACQNCGASLSNAPFSKESIPPWLRRGSPSGVYRCPHCSAIYSYRQAPISKEGMVTCQNCTRPFRPSKTSRVEQQSRHYY